jgi:hypothetical protein
MSSFLASQNCPTHEDDCHHEKLGVDMIFEGSKVFKSPTIQGSCYIDQAPTLLGKGAM